MTQEAAAAEIDILSSVVNADEDGGNWFFDPPLFHYGHKLPMQLKAIINWFRWFPTNWTNVVAYSCNPSTTHNPTTLIIFPLSSFAADYVAISAKDRTV
jgi:hypothetical protein